MAVLVGYATRYGSAAQVAERIADRLRSRGVEVALRPLTDALDPSEYDAVVLGSAVYSGSWLPDAVNFVQRHGATLAERPVWTFSVGSLERQRGLLRRRRWPDARQLPDITNRIGTRDHAFFGGVIDPAALPLLQRWVFRAAGGRYGDFRDRSQIDRWAARIAEAAAPEPVERRGRLGVRRR